MAGHNSADFLDDVAVVIDPGSSHTKVGFSGDERPRALVRWSGDPPAYRAGNSGLIGSFVGNLRPSGLCPGWEGLCGDWDALESHWAALWRIELGVCPRDHAVLLSDSPVAPPGQRTRVAELLFEGLSVPALYLSRRPLLALYSYGLISGLLVDAGFSATRVCPVYSGYCLPHAARSQPLGGAAVSAYLRQLLEEAQSVGGERRGLLEEVGSVGGERRGLLEEAGSVGGERHTLLEEVKRQSCYVSHDFEQELCQRSEVTEYQLPDGTTISLGDERFRCAELLFCPSLGGVAQPGLPALALGSLAESAPEWRRELLANVALAGGTSLLPGFPERVQAELERLAPRGSSVRVLSGSQRHTSAWLGGSIVASLGTFQRLWVSSADYQEHGPHVVQRRCY